MIDKVVSEHSEDFLFTVVSKKTTKLGPYFGLTKYRRYNVYNVNKYLNITDFLIKDDMDCCKLVPSSFFMNKKEERNFKIYEILKSKN